MLDDAYRGLALAERSIANLILQNQTSPVFEFERKGCKAIIAWVEVVLTKTTIVIIMASKRPAPLFLSFFNRATLAVRLSVAVAKNET